MQTQQKAHFCSQNSDMLGQTWAFGNPKIDILNYLEGLYVAGYYRSHYPIPRQSLQNYQATVKIIPCMPRPSPFKSTHVLNF